MATPVLKKKLHADAQRRYMNDPDHPERRKRKRAIDRAYAAAHAEKARTQAKAHYYANKETKQKYILEYQMRKKIKGCEYLGSQCMRCGFDHPSALQFHHRDPSQKLFNVTSKELSMPRKYPWDTMIVPELDKCDLLCANCHFLEHTILTPERVLELKAETSEERDSHYKYQEIQA